VFRERFIVTGLDHLLGYRMHYYRIEFRYHSTSPDIDELVHGIYDIFHCFRKPIK
jgi:hypothetical protein